jgi:hypothetical protein
MTHRPAKRVPEDTGALAAEEVRVNGLGDAVGTSTKEMTTKPAAARTMMLPPSARTAPRLVLASLTREFTRVTRRPGVRHRRSKAG